MSVVRNPSGSFSTADSNDRATQNNLVCLSDADRVRDEPPKDAVREDLRDAAATFVIGAEPRGVSAGAPRWNDVVEQVSPRESRAGIEAAQTLGQLMTEARNHLGLSREQVAGQTNIPAYYVRMIESDSYDAIPDQLYLLPFFRRYAIFLGLDAQKVVSRFVRDFEKAENEVLETPASKTPTAMALSRWRRIAAASVVGGILLPCIAWGIATIHAAYHQPATSLSAASSPDTQPSPAILPTDSRPATAPDSARTPAAVTVSPLATMHAETKPQRAVHGHQPRRRSRHSRQRPGHLT
ncbi:MAG: helix-turn-helix domain-containing protein [Candidatus Binatus sp.]